MGDSQEPRSLRRELGVAGAVFLGLGSILGTGVFVSLGLAAQIAGGAVLLAVVLAAVVAGCNGLSSAQLAACHPVSGGTYEYGYRELTPALGFTAGWMFLCAKSASAATAALGFAGYALTVSGAESDRGLVALAVGAVVVVTAIVLAGVRRSNVVNMVMVGVTLAALAAFVAACIPASASGGWDRLAPFWRGPADADAQGSPVTSLLHATALVFVAYTGYGRVATLGEEVRSPRTTIPRAVVVTLTASMVLYLAVSAAALTAVGAGEFAAATGATAAPLAVVADGFDKPMLARAVAIGAVTAMLGVLLNLVLGLSRVVLAMGRRGDLPGVTARIDASGATPWVATLVVGVIVTGITLVGDVKLAWSFSAFTVLVYYAITNLAALRLTGEHRLYPRAVSLVGLTGCLGLAFWVPWRIWLTGLALIAMGLIWHAVARARTKSNAA